MCLLGVDGVGTEAMSCSHSALMAWAMWHRQTPPKLNTIMPWTSKFRIVLYFIGGLLPYCPYWAPNAYAPQNHGHPDLDACGCVRMSPNPDVCVAALSVISSVTTQQV
jgi:hypothetical protein